MSKDFDTKTGKGGKFDAKKEYEHSTCTKCNAWKGQLGLEPTPELYVEHLVTIFREVKRVLRKDGTVWLNLGDSYAGSGCGTNDYRTDKSKSINKSDKMYTKTPPQQKAKNIGLKPKDLIGIPWRVAFALQTDGWWLRSDIIWNKPNPMPESVTDRPTKSHEYLFLLSKSKKYYYDADAIREEHSQSSIDRVTSSPNTGSGMSFGVKGERYARLDHIELNPAGRNKRSVWTINTKPYPEAHFAVFPEELVEPCILAGSSFRACEKCSAPFERETNVEHIHHSSYEGRYKKGFGDMPAESARGFKDVSYKNVETIGWKPTCNCKPKGTNTSTVLDPFAGSGTTLWVARKLGRNAIGTDINDKYKKLAEKRARLLEKDITTFK